MLVNVYLGKLGSEQKIGEIRDCELNKLDYVIPAVGDLISFGAEDNSDVLRIEQVLLDYTKYHGEPYQPTYNVFCTYFEWE